MQLLEWLLIILTYFAAYSVWSAFERYREHAAYRSKKTRRLVRFGVLALVLIGVGVAYNLPATQRLFPQFQVSAEETPQEISQETPQESEPAPLSERSDQYSGEYLPEYSPGSARLIVTPPLLSAAQNEAESAFLSVTAPPEITPKVPQPGTSAPAKPNEETSDAPRTPAEVSANAPAPPKKSRAQPSPEQSLRSTPPAITRSPERSVRVSFQSDPSGATLYMDGERVGVTPIEVAVEAGKRLHYTLKAEANLPNHELYYPHLDMLSANQGAALSVWLERLNSEEVAALRARGGARELPDFSSFD